MSDNAPTPNLTSGDNIVADVPPPISLSEPLEPQETKEDGSEKKEGEGQAKEGEDQAKEGEGQAKEE